MANDITPEVAAITKLNLAGNIIPNAWFEKLRTPAGKPDVIGAIILSEVVYWYRATEVRDEATGKTTGWKKKFAADLLQKDYEQLEAKFGFSRDQTRDALVRLEQAGLLQRVMRTVTAGGTKRGNVMFIKVFPAQIEKLTFSKIEPHSDPPPPQTT